jgi:hypothetical protein
MKLLLTFLIIASVSYKNFSQNVGIGTTSPTAKLEVTQALRSDIKIKSTSYNDTTQLQFVNRNSFNNGTDILLSSIREEGLLFSSKSDVPSNINPLIMKIRPNGNIGINYATATDKLEVNGNIAVRGNNFFEMGKGLSGKEINGGKIGYGVFGYPDALSIVGAGTSSTNRKIRLWSEGGTTVGGSAFVEGNLAVGTTTVPTGYKVSVDGKIIAEELRIQNSTAWPDYVFEKNYPLMSLEETEKQIKILHHLPFVPSAQEVENDGIIIGEMQKILLRKIEELTLHLIEQNKRINELQAQLNDNR